MSGRAPPHWAIDAALILLVAFVDSHSKSMPCSAFLPCSVRRAPTPDSYGSNWVCSLNFRATSSVFLASSSWFEYLPLWTAGNGPLLKSSALAAHEQLPGSSCLSWQVTYGSHSGSRPTMSKWTRTPHMSLGSRYRRAIAHLRVWRFSHRLQRDHLSPPRSLHMSQARLHPSVVLCLRF